MTPGIHAAEKAGIIYQIHQYNHDPSTDSYGSEAARKLGIPEQQVFKTLVVRLNTGKLAVGVVPVSSKLNMKRFAKALGVKKADMAGSDDVRRATGYIPGGVSPLGQKKRLRTLIDASANRFKTIFVSAGRRGLEIELAPKDLKTLTHARFESICTP